MFLRNNRVLEECRDMKTTMTFVVSLNIEKLRTGVTIVRNVISYV